MLGELKVSVAYCSQAGKKDVNQDACAARVPEEPILTSKGVALVIADGISSSQVSDVASQSAVKTFLDDYYVTPDAWSVKNSGERVLSAINSGLYAQTQRSEYRFDRDRGYVCTFSALVLKSATAHVLHVGDTRVYRAKAGRLEQLTRDHRVRVSDVENYLGRALGAAPELEVDYYGFGVDVGDVFVLASDGVYEYLEEAALLKQLEQADTLQDAADALVEQALQAGSPDNLTIQIARVESVPESGAGQLLDLSSSLPLPPVLEPGMSFDGFKIVRELHSGHRSHVYLALDEASGQSVALKIPALDLRADATALERFLLEEWIARRVNNPHVLKAYVPSRPRNFHYFTTEYLEGQTLAQWMRDHPRPELELVRRIVEQIARGLQAFHRQEMLHQDLRPENVLIDAAGSVKLIDFGSVYVAGLSELQSYVEHPSVPGTLQYAAPEYFLGEAGSTRSDLYSLAVICYQMLTGRLPYGAEAARARSVEAQSRLIYKSVLAKDREIPVWLDATLKRGVNPNPQLRYAELSEFVFDLRHPSRAFLSATRPSLLERDPAAFWKGVSLLLLVVLIVVLKTLH